MERKDKSRFGSDVLDRRTFLQGAPLIPAALLAAQQAAKATDAATPAAERAAPESAFSGNEVIWFKYPAEDWNTQALHLGNSYFGASFFGGVKQEVITLGEKTFWLGSPADAQGNRYGIIPGGKDALQEIRRLVVAGQIREADAVAKEHFQGNYSIFGSLSTVGNLVLNFDGQEGASSDYVRALDLGRAVGSVSYRMDGVRYRREYFCSYPARALVLHYTCDRPGTIGFSVQVELAHKKTAPTVNVVPQKGRLELAGQIDDNQLKYEVRVEVRHKGGKLTRDGDALKLSGAQEATVIYTVATEHRLEPPTYRGGDPAAITSGIMNRLQHRSYDALLKEHVADYQNLYQRTSLHLANPAAEREKWPTNQRWEAYSKVDFSDVGLKEMAFNFGKYLLISASRPGTLPAGIQGQWAAAYKSPWSGNYQNNINVQMIYMPGGVMGLHECQEPYIDWMRAQVVPGREVARAYYGTEGWVTHTTGNIWGYASPGASMEWGLFHSGGAWICRHAWEQYEFTQDKDYLRDKAYPLMKEAAQFYVSNLVEYQGHLICTPAVTAEQQSSLGYLEPPFQDVEMVGDLLDNVMKAATVLDVDADFRQRLADAHARMMPLKIGRLGQLQEWLDDIDDPNCRHRHYMHMFAVHPGQQINALTMPELAEACRVSMNLRGDGDNATRLDPKYNDRDWVCSCKHGGRPTDHAMGGNWSRGWKVWVWARLFDGNRADKIFSQLLGESGCENMTTYQQVPRYPEDSRSKPTQLDASVTTPGFVAEMLLQSQFGELHLLPALPDQWPAGSVSGLVARGGYKVDLKWEQGKLTSATITVPKGAATPPVRLTKELVDVKSDHRIQIVAA